MVAVLLWIGSLAILAAQLIAMESILNVVAGIPKAIGCAIGGTLITIYFAAGGLKTSVWVNVVQLIVKFAGFLVALPLALSAVGGWSAVRAMPVPADDYWNFFSGGASGLVYIALLTPAFIVSPGILQKLYGAKDDRTVRLGVGWSAAGLLAYAIVPVMLGMIARARVPDLPSSDMALPWILMHGVPGIVGAVGLAAVFSAELSAADAVLFMLTTSLSQDLYKRFVRPAATDAQVLKVARITAVVAGAIGTWLAIISPGVISALSIFYTLLGVTLFVPIIAGLYVGRAGTPEAIAAIAAGVVGMVGLQMATDGKGIGPLTPALFGLLLAVAGFTIILFARGRARESFITNH
jgi:SSS family solute:Na+ symporter